MKNIQNDLIVWLIPFECEKRKWMKKNEEKFLHQFILNGSNFIWIDYEFEWMDNSKKKGVKLLNSTQFDKGVKAFFWIYFSHFSIKRQKKKTGTKLNCYINPSQTVLCETIKFSKSILFVSMLLVSFSLHSSKYLTLSLTHSLISVHSQRELCKFLDLKKKFPTNTLVPTKFVMKMTRRPW